MHKLTDQVKRKISQLSQNNYFRAGLAIVISAVTLILSVRNVAYQDIWSALAKSDSRYVWLALASVVANNLAKTIRWKVLFGANGQKVSMWVIFQALLVGQTLNMIYPARIGDLSRIYIVGDRGAGRAFTLGTIIVEKILDTLFYALLVLMLVLSIPLPAWVSGWANKSVFVLIGASSSATILLMVIAYHPVWILKSYDSLVGFVNKRFPRLDLSRSLNWVHSGVSSLEILKSGKGLTYVTIWLVVSWGTALLNNQFALLALGIHLPLTASLLVLIVLQAGISIPSAPGRIGVFEYICVLTLAVFGISQTVAFTYGVLLHSIVFIPPMLLGLLFIVQLGLPIRRVGWVEASKENH
jgi:glycosyltransferase 2 family protein